MQQQSRQRRSSKVVHTPSPGSLRERMLQNCITAIKSKRRDLINRYRNEGTNGHQVIMRHLLNEAYHATKDGDYENLSNGNIENIDIYSQTTTGRNPFADEQELLENLGEAEHEELMRQVSEAVEAELSEEERLSQAADLYGAAFEEWVPHMDVEHSNELDHYGEPIYEPLEQSLYDDDNLICPLCTSSMVDVDEEKAVVTCSCGLYLNINIDSNEGSIGQHEAATGSSLTSAYFKQRLADTYDRHLSSCMCYAHTLIDTAQEFFNNSQQSQFSDTQIDQSAVLGYAPTFQLHEGRLVAFCIHCGFHEVIT